MDPAALLDFFGLSTGEAERLFLVVVRLSGLFLAAPFFSRAGGAGPLRIRVVLILALAVVLFPLVPPWSHEGHSNAPQMAWAALIELSIGAVLGMLIHWGLAAVQIAGNIIGFEMGLSMAQVMDPTSGMQENVLSNMLYMAAMLIFLTIDGHHMLLEGMARSFQILPPGGAGLHRELLLENAVTALMRMFLLSLLIAAPVIVASKLLYIGMGLVNRAAPQIQVFFLAMPLTQMVGFAVLGTSMALFGQVLVREINAFVILTFRMIGV
ncbi:MAG: flagellar biosynthetic protein FliR [Magnetococcales bacterium]|nr:flagellar biosynthetic protein FliR [Magnetococcales bacterium]